VNGEFFDSIGSASLLVYDHTGLHAYESPCQVQSGTKMDCLTPQLKNVIGKIHFDSNEQDQIDLHIGKKIILSRT